MILTCLMLHSHTTLCVEFRSYAVLSVYGALLHAVLGLGQSCTPDPALSNIDWEKRCSGDIVPQSIESVQWRCHRGQEYRHEEELLIEEKMSVTKARDFV